MAEAPGSFDPRAAGPGCDWFVLHVMSDAAPHLKQWIRHLGLHVHEFTHERKRRKKSPQQVITFPGYLFVGMNLENDPWHAIIQFSGIIRFLSTDGEVPTPLPPGAFVRFYDDHATFFRTPVSKTQASQHAQRLMKGMSAKLEAGPFATFLATVLEDQKGPDVKVSITIFGRSTTAMIDRSLLPEKM